MLGGWFEKSTARLNRYYDIGFYSSLGCVYVHELCLRGEIVFRFLSIAYRVPIYWIMLWSWALVPQVSQAMSQTGTAAVTPKQNQSLCPEPALSRLTRHRIASGETIESIARQYNLIPATLLGLNPSLRNGTPPVGTEISIPPYNGIRVEVPSGRTWRDVAKQYNVRADVLFEVNGCQESPSVVFVPGVNWSPSGAATARPSAPAADPLTRYPLPAIASVVRGYGWQLDPASGQVTFHNGVNLQASAGTTVRSVGEGTVAFAGEQSGYGKLVVINHVQGLQTRYSPLASINVQVGQRVAAGSAIGTVGATSTTTSPYLHFEVRSNSNLGWVAQDPSVYIPDLRTADQRKDRGLGRAAGEQ